MRAAGVTEFGGPEVLARRLVAAVGTLNEDGSIHLAFVLFLRYGLDAPVLAVPAAVAAVAAAAAAGKAVLCTKPLGRNAQEAQRILEAVERAIAAQPALWIPVVLHLSWEADSDWADLKRLARRLSGHARPWGELAQTARPVP